MPQSLSEVQRKFVNQTLRPHLERIVAFQHELDMFVTAYDNQAEPIAEDAEDLADGNGALPRTDAPRLTGLIAKKVRDKSASMRDQLDGPTLNNLIKLMVRSLRTVTREG